MVCQIITRLSVNFTLGHVADNLTDSPIRHLQLPCKKAFQSNSVTLRFSQQTGSPETSPPKTALKVVGGG